jgi:hypothetical protein
MHHPPPEIKRTARMAPDGSGCSLDGKFEPLLNAIPTRHGQAGFRRHGLSGQERRYLHSKPQAEALAAKIVAFWQGKGQPVSVWVEMVHAEGADEWVCRSSIALGVRP